MRNKTSLFFFLILFSLTGYAQTYIRNVTVVDVLSKKLLPGQTVVVTNDLVTDVKPAGKIKIPGNAPVIDGTGKFLMPGLTDAHVHFFQSGGLYTRPDALDLRKVMPYEKEIAWAHNNMEDLLRRYLRAGITTVIDVGATYSFLQQRDSFANKHYAPSVYMTGPLLTSWEPPVFKNLKNDEPFKLVTEVEEARKMVREQMLYHTDFIKIWYIVNPDSLEASARKFEPIVKAIIDEAHKHNMKVAVHATERFTAQLAVEDGCDFLVHDVEDEIVSDDFVKLLKAKKTILCPTLIVMGGYNHTFGQTNNFSLYDLTRSNPKQIGSLYDLKHFSDNAVFVNGLKRSFNLPGNIARAAHDDSLRKVNLKKMADGGVIIAAGTDAGNIGTQHATSLLTELKAMQASGLTTWQILESATINAAKIFDKQNSTGSITAGKTADMILLNANPLEQLDNLTRISLVFNKGYAIDPDTLIKETPLALVQRQLNAYNARNIDAFLEPYSDSTELFLYPNLPLGKGKESMRKDYTEMFTNTPGLHCEVTERIIQGKIIIDKEVITNFGQVIIEATVIYHIENNKIRKAYFIQ